MNEKALGVCMALLSCVLMAAYTAYVGLLKDYSSFVVMGQRVIWALTLVLLFLAARGQVASLLLQLRELSHWPGLVVGAVLIAPQYWIFAWAPVNGHILDLALAYFVFPLLLVFIGRLFFNNHLRPIQWIAVVISFTGVAHAVTTRQGLSWVIPWCCIGMSLYFLHKQTQTLPILTIFIAENLLLLPLALIAVVAFSDANHPFDFSPATLGLFIGSAAIISAGFVLMLEGNQRLPIALFGLLTYFEPTLIFIIGLILGASVALPLTYGTVCFALLLLAIDAIHQIQRPRNKPSTKPVR